MNDLHERISKLSPEKQALLREMLLKKSSGDYQSIPRRLEQNDIPLSFAQLRLWFLDQLEPGKTFYNLSITLQLKGQLNIEALEYSFNEIIRRHEIFRTIFVKKGEFPIQVISPPSPVSLPVIDIRHLPKEIQDVELRKLSAQDSQRPFDLAKGPLLRFILFRLNAEEHMLMISMHHIVTDGWSMGIFIRELSVIYETCLKEKRFRAGLPELPIQYADFACWQRTWLNTEKLSKELDFWKKQLEAAPPVLDIPFDRPRPPEQSFQGHAVRFEINSELTEQLNAFSHRTESTLFMTLLAAFAILLFRYSGQEDVSIGTPVANRNRKEIESLIGFFVNTLVLRLKLSGNPTVTELLNRVRQAALDAYSHQDLPFEQLVEILQPERDMSYTPLFQVMFVLQNAPIGKLELPGLTIKILETETISAMFDLTLNIVETESGLSGKLEYKTDLFDEPTIQRMAGNFQTLLKEIVSNPVRQIIDLPMLTQAEHRRLLEFNNTEVEFPRNKTIIDLFEAQVQKTPDNTALIFEDTEISYRELNERANQIAHFLKDEFNIQPDERIGVVLERSEWIIIGMLGIMKAGGAYVPMDTGYPPERIRYMLEDSRCKVILTNETYSDILSSMKIKSRFVTIWNIRHSEKNNPQSMITPHNLAYLIYTSGSTGQPKGVMLEHQGFINMVFSQIALFNVTKADRFLQFSSCSFDASMYETFIALLSGAGLVCLTKAEVDEPELFLRVIEKCRVTLAVLPPTYLRVTGFEALRGLRTLITAGENALSDEGKYIDDNHLYWNAYGPTEFSVCATCYLIPNSPPAPLSLKKRGGGSEAEGGEFSIGGRSTIPIGKPISNAEILILDPAGKHLQPIGVPGEICLSGVGLARGYLNKPELTAQKFVPHLFKPGQRMYRTGDLGRWLPNGNIEFLGRNDVQVKIRGYRIELEEIEYRLQTLESVKEAAVIAKEITQHIKELIAYVVSKDNHKLNVNTIREHLKKTLPDYMIPSYCVQLDKLPLTPNGKVDKKALPAPAEAKMDSGIEYEAPRNEAETVLAKVWSDLLNIDIVGIHDNYFSLGGDSIKAIQVVSRLAQRGWKMAIRNLFRYPTIAELAPYIEPNKISLSEKDDIVDFSIPAGAVPLTAVQKWFFENIIIDRNQFNQAILLKGKPRFREKELKLAFEAIASRHDTLRLKYIQQGELLAKPAKCVTPAKAGVQNALKRLDSGFRRNDVEGLLQVTQDETIIQKYHDSLPPLHFEICDLSGSKQPIRKMEALINKLHASFDLEQGPLIKIALYRLEDADRLLITIHHLVVDGVSLRFLLEDLNIAYSQAIKGQPIRLPPATSNFHVWAEKIYEYSQSKQLELEKEYWRQIAAIPQVMLPSDLEPGENLHRYAGMMSVELSQEQTTFLLRDVHHAYNSRIDDLLLAALAESLHSWTGNTESIVLLAAHGRESVVGDVDVSRTVGWFSSMYPIHLTSSKTKDFRQTLTAVKETIRKIPNKGIGYSILRFITGDEVLTRTTLPEIVFNYLGQFDEEIETESFSMAPEPVGQRFSLSQKRCHALELTGVVIHRQFNLFAIYDGTRFLPSTIRKLLEDYRSALQNILPTGIK